MTKADEPVAIVELAEELGVRKQWLFKIVKRLGASAVLQRSGSRAGQKVSVVSAVDAERIRQEVAQAKVSSVGSRAAGAINPLGGYFYVIRLEPGHDFGRFKVGYTNDLDLRLQKHRTAAPFADYIRTWPCRQTWERAAIDSVTNASQLLRGEVYRTENMDSVLERAEAFFALMPKA